MAAKRNFQLALALCLVTWGFQFLTGPTPNILCFEFAFTEARAADLEVAWKDSGDDDVALNLWLDFLFICGYVSLYLASIGWAMRPAGTWLYAHGPRLQLGALAAGALDVVENSMLLLYLGPGKGLAAVLLPVAGVAAGLKFLLLGVVAVVFLRWLWRRRRGQPPPQPRPAPKPTPPSRSA